MSKNEVTECCKRCGHDVSNNYCPNCGSPRTVQKIDTKYLIEELISVFNLEKGILFTIRETLLRPGESIRMYLKTDRSYLVKPVLFIILCSLVYTFTQQLLQFHDGYIDIGTGSGDPIAGDMILTWISENYGYSNILIAFFIALWTKLFFRKQPYSYFEAVVLLCYVMGISMLIYTIFGVAETILNISTMQIGAMIGFFYSCWAIGRFYEEQKVFSYIKAFICYILGTLTFILSAFSIVYLTGLF
jgi:hypothetical protein